MVHYAEYPSPVGRLLLVSDGEALTQLKIDTPAPANALPEPDPILQATAAWLDAYFRGIPQPLAQIPLHPEGSPFRQQVWQLLLQIPYGAVRTYGDIAREMAALTGKPRMSAQAVGGAVGRNPIGILIPCHRVVGTGGKLTGYAWGLEKKQWLLHHERGGAE